MQINHKMAWTGKKLWLWLLKNHNKLQLFKNMTGKEVSTIQLWLLYNKREKSIKDV